MPVRFVGREPLQKGKSLYEISRQLANGGVGRVVFRQKHAEYWPEQKSFFRLTKVVPDKTCVDYRKGEAWGIKVFRGAEFGECRIGSGHKSDWRLVPKDQEESFCHVTDVWPQPEAPPSHIPAPPWLNTFLKKQSVSDQNYSSNNSNEPVQIPLSRLVKTLDRIN